MVAGRLQHRQPGLFLFEFVEETTNLLHRISRMPKEGHPGLHKIIVGYLRVPLFLLAFDQVEDKFPAVNKIPPVDASLKIDRLLGFLVLVKKHD